MTSWWRRATPAQRLRVASIPLALGIVGIGVAHALDARARGQSLWPVALGLALSVAVIVAVFRFVRRPVGGLDPAEAMRARSRQIIRWAAPLAVAAAVLAALLAAAYSRR